ncbi:MULTISPECIES: MFS transporter [unclassified Pseudomonas]|uniref:MFS transporter n=1 Tax=unclassified Pseudomonas TaxID=196821 RepID=UPI000D3B7BAD|nr:MULTISPECIES: MFS transporter [unclassified Pseudomonas]RAU45224.1 MFS transporter [Pseudomonas sp. RIT 409]RAU51498.1 MFS transporter [Pseudomonas sp. RIT 412]
MKSQLTRAGSFVLLAVASLTIMVGCVIVPGLPTIARQLGVGNAASWLVTLPSLGVIIFGPLAGKLIDRIGLYKALCFGLFTYGLLGVAGFLILGPLVFVDRFFLGGSTVLIMAAGTGLISEFYEGKARLNMIAKQGMSIELGGVIFLFVAGVLANVGWQWPFVLYLSSWVLLALVLTCVPQPVVGQHACVQRQQTATPSADLRVVYASAVLSMAVFFTAIIMLPLRLHGLGLNEAQVGYFLSYVSLIAVCAAAIMPIAARKMGDYSTLIAGFISYALAHLAFMTAEGLAPMIEGGLCLGLGFGLTIPMVNHLTIEFSHPAQRGRNLAWLSVAIFAGQFISSFMDFIPGGQAHGFLGAAGIAGVAVGILAVSIRTRRSRHAT